MMNSRTCLLSFRPRYDAAGSMVSGPKTGAPTTRLRHDFDAWTGFDLARNRCYSVSPATWIKQDPIAADINL
jgi:hypothetical protein